VSDIAKLLDELLRGGWSGVCPDDGVGALARGLGGEPAAVVGTVPEDDWR
jgi:hypothetical protein